ncbi:GA28568 gene product from transcript GA28568-RA [Rhizoctonia solani AG-1 IB]|uniref:GA28568 gene product from transcript GA28568-RA n=1 Tax=Thanatephorus cucumeris (strain AG1-IB / isolate 7/3/14) TaxID=1108050 RepID=A0A0B7FZI9_THACB|nr:GA28568 gene product from transcript GA28568-RA [Rhizoctonia solani AG-1 IB]
MPEVVDPAPLPPIGGSAWSNLKNRIGGKLKRSNSRSDSYSQDSYLDDPGMYGAGRPAYSTSNRDNPSRSDLHSRSQYASPDRDMPSRIHYPPPERDMPSRSQYAPERDIPSRSQYAPERDIPSRSQYAPERDIPSRSQYASERDIPSRSQHTHDRSPTSDRYVPPPPPLVPMNGMNSMTGMTSMAGVGSMSGMGSLGGMTGLTTLVPGPGSGPGAGPGAGPGMGPGVGPGAGPVAGPSSLHIPQATHEMKASRKSSRRAKSNIPPPQPTFSSAPPTAPEAPIHPVPHNNALASPWHHKSGATFPESWIPEADDEGHIFLPPAHEIQPSPRAVDNELGERFLHPIVPNAPVPKTPKHRAGSQPTAPYTPMVFPDDYSEDYSDDMDIPIADRPDFDPMVVRTPAHYGRPLSVIPELSPENQAPPIPEAPLPSGRYSTRSKYSQPTYRQESDDRSATISVESGAGDASVHRSIRRRPSSITPTSPAPPVVQQHVPDDPRTPPPPIVPNAIIPVGPISPEPVPPVPRKTKADRQRAREAERAREEAWEMEERERVRQERAQELSERERQQQELDRRIQEQRARAAHDIERQQERERKEREREERHRERERRDGERARKEKEREQKEQEKERRHRERDLRNRTERRRGYNPTTTAPIVAPNPVVSPSPGPETSPHEPTSRIPLSEDRQITFPMPHVVPPPEQIVGPPTMIVEPPSMIVGGPSRIVEGPSRIVEGPSRIVGGPTTRIGEGPSQIGERPLTSIGEGLSQVVEGPSYVARPSEKIVIPRIVPPPSIPDDHYTPYSPISISGPASASTDPRRRSYGYAPATSATPVTPRTQPAPMKMPSPEPWHDPDNPRRRANADEAAINAYVRAVEQARKLQAGEDDDEEDEEVQRQMKAKFGDLSGNHSDEDENNEDNSEDMTSEDSESGTELSESTVSGSQQHDSTNGDSYHPGYPSNYTPGYPSNYPSSYHSNYPSNYPSTQHSNHDHDHDDRSVGPSIVLQSPSNDSNGSSAVTHTSNAQMLHPEYRHNPRQADHSYDDPAEFESLENEPLDLSDVPPVPGLDPYSGSMASPGSRYYGLPSDYVDAPRMPRHSSASVNRPPPLATDSGYNSQWAPIRPPSAGLQPPGLPDFANFEGDFDRGKQRQDYRPPRSNPSRSSGRDSASSVGRPNIPTVPPSVVITPANTSQPSTQRTGTAELAPERTPGSGYPSAPGFATRIGAGLTGMMFSRPGFMRSPSAQQTTVPPPVVAPMTDPAPPPGAPPISGPLPSRSPIPPSQGGSRAPSGMGTRPEINRVRNTLGPTLQVPMAGMGSPNRPNVVANRNKNKTMAQVEAFRALQVEQDLERQRQWDAGHGDAEMSRPSSPQESVRSKKSRAVTVVSMSDEDDWTTGRSMKGRPL